LSEEGSNSWCEEASMSANDPNNVDEDYDDEDEDGKKKKVRFNKDDGDQNFLFKSVFADTTPKKPIEIISK
jgi:hypothetical protein